MKAAALALLLLAATPSDEVTITATSVNVAQPGTPVTIRIVRWSTDAERAPFLAALNPAPPQPSALPTVVGRNPSPAETGRGRGAAAAGRGRGGRGRGAATPLSPIDAFTAALGRAPTIGYIWTSDITGYSIKYAWHSPQPDGTDRIVVASDRRLGAYTDAWKPVAAEASAKAAAAPAPETDYGFTLIELRAGSKGLIEGKTSLTNKIAVDADAKTIALENYAAATTTLNRKPAASTAPSQPAHR
jgi:hypothetical protein